MKKLLLCISMMMPCSVLANTDSDMLQVESYLKQAHIQAQFDSVNQKGKEHNAGIFEYAPGYLKIMYTYPYHAVLIANNKHLYFHIDENDSTTRMNITNQPLGIFLSNDINKWNTSHPIIQHANNSLQFSLANSYGVIAMNFTTYNNMLTPYSIDMKDRQDNIKHIQFSNIQSRAFSKNNFDIPKDTH